MQPPIGMALIERMDYHSDWCRELLGHFLRPDGCGSDAIYDESRILNLTYRQQGKDLAPLQD
ncbi:hypothetical protein [Desulfobacca acetoxidans]